MVAPAVALWVIFTAWPIVTVIRFSMLQTNFITQKFVGLQNFRTLFGDDLYRESFKTTAVFSLLVSCRYSHALRRTKTPNRAVQLFRYH
jgi:sn-glycerol 3-phosphate transport system permease protein